MKKILPILTIIGASTLIVGCSSSMNIKKENFINNLNSFKQNLHDYTSLNQDNLAKTVFNKYNLTIETQDLKDIQTIEDNVEEIKEIQPNLTSSIENSYSENEIDKSENIEQENTESNEDQNLNEIENLKSEKISTLYSLSSDIEDSCDEFCELKEEITEAIVETQNLINKLQQKELELTKEQRMFITEQSTQLKNLGRQLSNITTELSFHLSDLNQVILTSNQDIDSLNLKYLVVLDNLVNGNEMLQSSLSSLNMINQMFNIRTPLPPNNQGRILYGFQHNNNPPVIKDYYIDENGEFVENPTSDNTQNEENSENQTEIDKNAIKVESEKQTNIDTYKEKVLNTNIDSYYTNNPPRNIDSFFNTALLDNEFMYGNGAYSYAGMNGMYGHGNPYMQNYANYERNNTNYGGTNYNNTPNDDKSYQQDNKTKQTKKESKRIKLKKNIDTYKDENEPDIKTKLANIKNSISGFFGKFKSSDLKTDLSDKIDNPIYRFDAKKEQTK